MTNEPNFGPSGQECKDCGVYKPLGEFGKKKENRHGYRYDCKDCVANYQKTYRQANKDLLAEKRKARYTPEQIRAYEIYFKYGVTLEWYSAQADKQNGVCAICNKPPTEGTNFAIDHDHSCCPGKRTCGNCVRALLCNRCNPGLGYFQDNKDLLLAAVEYLRSYK